MTETLRKRCQILRQIEALAGYATVPRLTELLPEIGGGKVISSAIARLLDQDRIRVVGKEPNPNPRGRRMVSRYDVNPEWDPNHETPRAKRARLRRRPKAKSHGKAKRELSDAALGVVRFRQQKIGLLRRLRERAHGNDYDLLTGLLRDLGDPELPRLELVR